MQGLWLAIAVLAMFLVRRPLKLTIMDWRHHMRSRHTIVSECFVVTFSSLAALAFLVAIKTSDRAFILPLLIAAPLVLVQLYCDSMGKSRALLAELSGSLSIGAVASAIVLQAGWSSATAFGLWAILAARSAPTIFYLRARLRLARGKSASIPITILMHVIAATAILVLATRKVVPYLAVVALAVLLIRATLGLVAQRRPLRAKQLGLREILYGSMTVFLVIMGHAINW